MEDTPLIEEPTAEPEAPQPSEAEPASGADGASEPEFETADEADTFTRQSAAEQILWMALQDDGTWLPLPAANSDALEAKWLERTDEEKDVDGHSAGTAASAAARVPLELAKQMLGEVLADSKAVRRVLKWSDSADNGLLWHGDAAYANPATVDEPLFPVELQNLCVRNGVFALSTEDCNQMLARLASLHLLAANRRVRPASLMGSPREAANFPQDTRDTKVASCSWCRRVTLHEMVSKNLTSRHEYVCQSCAQMGLDCKACVKAKLTLCGMACKRPTFSDTDCFVHTYIKPPAEAEAIVPAGLVHQPIALCPWCGVMCKQVIDEINTAPRRSAYKCSTCRQRTLACKGKAHQKGSSEMKKMALMAGPDLPHSNPQRMELAVITAAEGEERDVPANVIMEAQRLRSEAAKVVDAGQHAEHGELLQHIREVAGMPEDAQWQALGFQNEQPSTDFRATGLLGLLATVHFTEQNVELVKDAYANSVADFSSGAPFPFALVSINACAALVNLLELDSPVPDSPLLLHAVKFGDPMSEFGDAAAGAQQSLELAFFRLHSAMVNKLAATWQARSADAVDFEAMLGEVSASLATFLSAPVGFSSRRAMIAPGDVVEGGAAAPAGNVQEALDEWTSAPDSDSVVVELPSLPPRPSEAVTPLDATWGSPLSELQTQKYRLLHRFTNRTAHRLMFVAEHTNAGSWFEQPPRTIDPGATVYWGSCGKERAFGLSTGSCGAVLYHADTFDISLIFTRSVGPLGVDTAGSSVYPPLQVTTETLGSVYDTLWKSVSHSSSAKGVQLSCGDPQDCEYGLKSVEWVLADADDSANSGGGTAQIALPGAAEDIGAFCRGHPLWDDDYCFDCMGVHPAERVLVHVEGAPPRFCSWCFDYSPVFKLVQKNGATRDEWECGTCGGTCHKCAMTTCPHLARGGTANMAGFNRMRCDRCRLGDEACSEISAKMATMDAGFREISTSTDAMRAALKKGTPELKLALAAGMLRPFLALVAMGWRQRRSLAMQLGWSIVESPGFGDAHTEAWEIVSRPGSGIQDRANQSYEKVNAFAADADWDEVINRVAFAAFGCSRYVKSYDIADPSEKVFNPVTEAKRQKEERMSRLRNPLDPRIRELEDEVMEKLWCSKLGDSAPDERDAMDMALRQPESQQLWRRLREECGISNGFAACYFLHSLVESEGKRAAAGGETETEELSRRQQFLASECRDTFGAGGVTNTAVLLDQESIADAPAIKGGAEDAVDLHSAVKDKEDDVSQESEAVTAGLQETSKTAGTRAVAVAGQAAFQGTMRATGNAAIAPVLGTAGAAVATSAMMGIGIALVVKDLVKICFGSSEARLISTVRAIVCTRYALALRGILLEELYPLEDDAVE